MNYNKRMKKLLSIIILIHSIFSNAFSFDGNLELNKIYLSSFPLELSGFVKWKGQLYAISDNSWDTWLYKVDFEKSQATITKSYDLEKLEGYWPYLLKSKFWKQGGRWFKASWDLEGAAACGDTLYLINEQVRNVIKVSDQKLERIDFDFEPIFKKFGKPLAQISANAGFEGIAVDCENHIAYIAQERDPRGIIVADLKTTKVTNIFKTPPMGTENPDYADLFFDNGFLYALERNARRIIKIAPKTGALVAQASYENLLPDFKTAQLYDTGEVFGLGEALFLDEKYIIIGNDNNVKPFSQKAKERFGFSGNNSTVLRFIRPEGF